MRLFVSLMIAIASFSILAGESYKVDPVHSMILFSVKHLNVSYAYGQFTEFEGAFQYDAETGQLSDMQVKINANSVTTQHAKRDKHIKSVDFFDVMQFPDISFKAKSATKNDKGGYTINGDMTLHGVTKPATFEIEEVGSGNDPWGGFRRGFHGTATIKRSDFDMSFLLEGVSDEVKIIVSLETVKQ
ncbi:MAG: YceI family protein [Acidobacteria bacterium]|nr:YceI family protein [Acidobacteriota bacterium]